MDNARRIGTSFSQSDPKTDHHCNVLEHNFLFTLQNCLAYHSPSNDTHYFLVHWFSNFGEFIESPYQDCTPYQITPITQNPRRWEKKPDIGILSNSWRLSFTIDLSFASYLSNSNCFPFISQNWILKPNFPLSCDCFNWLLYYLEMSLIC